MYTIYQGESLLIPASVDGDKAEISNLTCALKYSKRGEIPNESDAVVAYLSVADYTNADINITDGYLFSLQDTSAIEPGIYFVNYEFTSVTGGYVSKGVPLKVTIKPSVI